MWGPALTDIPERLIDAWQNAPESIVETIAAVLAALRPEDAHLVPAWQESKAECLAARRQDGRFITENGIKIVRLQRERDEARAEVERLRASLSEVSAAYLQEGGHD